MNKLLAWWKDRQIRKTGEAVAYWTSKADALRQICNCKHSSDDRHSWVNAAANRNKYQYRLQHLLKKKTI